MATPDDKPAQETRRVLPGRFAPYKELLLSTSLFHGMSEAELAGALRLVGACVRRFGRGELIQRLGEPFSSVGIVVSGCIEGSFDSERFDRVDVARFVEGDVFGAAFGCAATKASPIQLETESPSVVVLLDVMMLMRSVSGRLERDDAGMEGMLREMMLRNLLSIVSRQAALLNQRMRILEQRTLRERILVFLRGLPSDTEGWRDIGLTRIQMAGMVGANRSAMSRELGRMQDDGVLAVNGRKMRLLC